MSDMLAGEAQVFDPFACNGGGVPVLGTRRFCVPYHFLGVALPHRHTVDYRYRQGEGPRANKQKENRNELHSS